MLVSMSSQGSVRGRRGGGEVVGAGAPERVPRRFTPGGGLYVEGAPPQVEPGASEVVREADGELPVVTIRPAPARLKLV
jgi:hypothetical protein